MIAKTGHYPQFPLSQQKATQCERFLRSHGVIVLYKVFRRIAVVTAIRFFVCSRMLLQERKATFGGDFNWGKHQLIRLICN